MVTLPLALSFLGGTALGTALAANTWLVVVAATLYFVVALAGGVHLLGCRTEPGKTGDLKKLAPRANQSEGER